MRTIKAFPRTLLPGNAKVPLAPAVPVACTLVGEPVIIHIFAAQLTPPVDPEAAAIGEDGRRLKKRLADAPGNIVHPDGVPPPKNPWPCNFKNSTRLFWCPCPVDCAARRKNW